MYTKKALIPLYIFNAMYVLLGGLYFLQDLNNEFVIYIVVIVAILTLVFSTLRYTGFPLWMLWMLSGWGLLHVLGGAVETPDGVLFAYKIYPFIDAGGEMYILKYDQVVHGYLYGLVAVMAYHVLRALVPGRDHVHTLTLAAILVSVGISSLNEIMEFFIAISLERNGVGGYENAMLDFIFNLSGAVVAMVLYHYFNKKSSI